MEGDIVLGISILLLKTSFQSTPSAWRETNYVINLPWCHLLFQSTPSAWRETFTTVATVISGNISIHSLRMEGDAVSLEPYRRTAEISIHSLRMEGDFEIVQIISNYIVFQSTPSAWRETQCGFSGNNHCKISIHSLRMEGDSLGNLTPIGDVISIHSLRMEGDLSYCAMCTVSTYFNPLPPHGGRLASIMTSDVNPNFNPLPPHGGRPISSATYFPAWNIFQSTPSAWRETSGLS